MQNKHFSPNHYLSETQSKCKNAKLALKQAYDQFYGTTPDYYKIISYEKLYNQNQEEQNLDPTNLKKYNNIKLKKLIYKHHLALAFLDLPNNDAKKKHQNQLDKENLITNLSKIKNLDKFITDNPNYDFVEFHHNNYEFIKNASNQIENIADNIFTDLNNYRDKNYKSLPHGTEKEHYKPYSSWQTAKWIAIEIAVELIFGFITTLISFGYLLVELNGCLY